MEHAGSKAASEVIVAMANERLARCMIEAGFLDRSGTIGESGLRGLSTDGAVGPPRWPQANHAHLRRP
jgi:hypothetical protein